MSMIQMGNGLWRFEEDAHVQIKTCPLGIANIQMSFQFDEHQEKKENGLEEKEKQLELDFDAPRCDEQIEEKSDNPEASLEKEKDLEAA